MDIKLHQIKIRELCESYEDLSLQEEGITGYGGRLNIRPKYQREFVYDDKKRNAVMDTVWKGFPLNVMYWVRTAGSQKAEEESEHTRLSTFDLERSGLSTAIEYELLDGQQRTISICSFIAGEYMMNFDGNLLGFNNMTETQKNRILDYELQVYICENGTDEEKLHWFNIINIAGEKLTEQEIRNAVYSGSWVTQAKRRFSKTGCVAYKLASDYMSGSPIRQDYFETALKWIGDKQGMTIEEYMVTHQHDTDADEIWQYFTDVMHWVQSRFPKTYGKVLKQVEWGMLYNKHKDSALTATALQQEINRLMKDSDVQKKAGVFWYVYDHKEQHLGIRAFDDNTKVEVYLAQDGICPICGNHFKLEEMEADHITPWVEGGHTVKENCQMLCRDCNRRKSSK